NHKNKYDMYMFYEDDLSYFGKENLFDLINFNNDILFQNICININTDKNWYWYKIHDYNILNSYTIYHSLMNIYAANSNFIEGLMKFMNTNYMHHEGLIPTYALNNDYKIDYINKYISLYCNHIDNIKNIKINLYNLIHPIKDIETYNRIKFKKTKNYDIRQTVE
ncbi:hypothetical protein IKN40_03800, partial [bacterium]|nr:hypothetical protein [bacterium]